MKIYLKRQAAKDFIVAPNIDFVGSPPWSRTNILWIGSFCFLISLSSVFVYKNHAHLKQLIGQQQQLTLQLKKNTQPILVLNSDEEKAITQKYHSLQKVNEVLAQNMQIFSLLESCVSQDWSFLSIKPNVAERTVNLMAETRDVTTLNNGLECLENAAAFSRVKLLSQQRVVDDPLRPIRAELSGEY